MVKEANPGAAAVAPEENEAACEGAFLAGAVPNDSLDMLMLIDCCRCGRCCFCGECSLMTGSNSTGGRGVLNLRAASVLVVALSATCPSMMARRSSLRAHEVGTTSLAGRGSPWEGRPLTAFNKFAEVVRRGSSRKLDRGNAGTDIVSTPLPLSREEEAAEAVTRGRTCPEVGEATAGDEGEPRRPPRLRLVRGGEYAAAMAGEIAGAVDRGYICEKLKPVLAIPALASNASGTVAAGIGRVRGRGKEDANMDGERGAPLIIGTGAGAGGEAARRDAARAVEEETERRGGET